MKCGSCGKEREAGDICCKQQAANQGRIHATCSHEPPPMMDEFRTVYESAREAVLEELTAEQTH